MNSAVQKLCIVTLGFAVLSGCSAYRVSSNIDERPLTAQEQSRKVTITQARIMNREYRFLGPVEVSIKKATIFHADPSRDQANEELEKRARMIGADAVMEVKYEGGIGAFTWGYLDAEGKAVKYTD